MTELAEVMTAGADEALPFAAWREHCKSAVRKFVANAVVIDNQPVVGNVTPAASDEGAAVLALDDGMGMTIEDTVEAPVAVDTDEEAEAQRLSDHELNIRVVSDAFAQEEILCSFVLPDDNVVDDEGKIERITSACRHADMVIIDWYLKDKDPTITTAVLRKLAEEDVREKGRLRLICIYTGQPTSFFETIYDDAVNALKDGGIEFSSEKRPEGYARSSNLCFLILNKSEVIGGNLPEKLIDVMTDLTQGLLPSFALAAVAAVRRNVHHIATRFSADLDAAFVSNRLITDPPEEVAELMRELFVSECDTALGLEKVADQYLSKAQIRIWLEESKQPKTTAKFKVGIERPTKKGTTTENKELTIDTKFLHERLDNSLFIDIDGVGKIEFPEKSRGKVSAALHDKDNSSDSERKFARFASLKREAFSNTKVYSEEGWTPSLTLGTLLKENVERKIADGEKETISKYYYCLTPTCDTLRLHDTEKTFLMLELEESKGKANLIIADEGGGQKKLHINAKPSNLRTFRFKGNADTGRVQATPKEASVYVFTDVQKPSSELLWIGEVRRNRATRDMAELNRNWLRFGIKDSEYLRLSGKGEISI